jgi:sulfite reductase (ferredoxin)
MRQHQTEVPFMVRCNIPGGRLTAEQYLLLDQVAAQQMRGSLRITTRYNLQLHGVLTGELEATIAALAAALKPLLRASDAVGRPIMSCPAPAASPAHATVDSVARQLSEHLLGPATGAYEIWFGGEKIADSRSTGYRAKNPCADTETSIHFKVGIAAPDDNCIDVFTHDLGLVPVVREGALRGFNMLIGGSMGMGRRSADALPRVAEPLVFVQPTQVLPVFDQLMALEGEAAASSGRQRGRFKHLLAAWGMRGLRSELERRLGSRLRDAVTVQAAPPDLHLGWHAQGNDLWYVGLSIENGRLQDQGERRLLSGLRDVVGRFRPDVRLTPNQDLLLTNLSTDHCMEVERRLRAHGIAWPDDFSSLRRYAMACPAMPTCGHAVAEAERALPALIEELERIVVQLGLPDDCLSIRMNGCSFGCTRPYVADLAFVGDAPDRYSVFVGGRLDGSRVNWLFKELIPGEALLATVRPLLLAFSRERKPDEMFGDFCTRVGRKALQAFSDRYGDEDGFRC